MPRSRATNASGCVWWAACRAPGIVTTRPSRSRASRARVASPNGAALSPPRIWSTGWRTSPSAASDADSLVSARSSRIVVPTAAARRGQIGSARNAARSGSGIPTISRMNVASASSRSPAATSVSIRRSVAASGSW